MLPLRAGVSHRGTLMVAEVASRFDDMRAFMSAMAQLGFKSVSKVNPQGSRSGGAEGSEHAETEGWEHVWGTLDPLGLWCWGSGRAGHTGGHGLGWEHLGHMGDVVPRAGRRFGAPRV